MPTAPASSPPAHLPATQWFSSLTGWVRGTLTGVILYHFTTSPFARRVRLTLALKGIAAELRDARAEPAHRAEVQRLNPLHTVPVLVDAERVVIDSHAICQYLDRKVPEPPLWPAGVAGAEAFELQAVCDSAIQLLSDLGMRYAPLHGDPNFPLVREQFVARVQRSLELLAHRVAARSPRLGPLCGDTWGGADMAVYTLVTWLEGLPKRAPTFAPARSVVELGWTLPVALSQWANQHRNRADALALD